LKIDVFAAHAGLEHDEVMKQMLAKGYKFMITQIAAEGLGANDLGRVLDPAAMDDLFKRSQKFGFHCGGEGGHYDTLTLAGPIFSHELVIETAHKVIESECVGHLVVDSVKLVPVAKLLAH
jgi:diphthamide synthase (EF-2-diphthine--ammonia ligase)